MAKDLFDVLEMKKLNNSEIITPHFIVEEMVNLIDPELFNKNTKFLDPAVTSGRFLVEIKNRLMNSPSMIRDFPDKSEREQWILTKQLYGLACNRFSSITSHSNLYGNIRMDGNIRYIEGYTGLLSNKQRTILKINKEFGENMHFDIVIGNPPYQETTGGARGNLAKDIFDQFIILGTKLTDNHLIMIVPTKWYNKDSLENVREALIRDKHLASLVVYDHANEVFEADIGGGVCYFDWSKHNKFDETTITTVSGDNKNTVKRPLTVGNNIVIDNVAYGIISKCFCNNMVEPSTGDNPFGVASNDFGNIDKQKDTDVRLIKGSGINIVEAGYFELESISNPEIANRFKVGVGIMNPDRGGGKQQCLLECNQ